MGWDGMGVRFIVISLLVAVIVDTVTFLHFFFFLNPQTAFLSPEISPSRIKHSSWWSAMSHTILDISFSRS